ncbi:trans-sialidase, putative, partial [Trypanosoma cruzi marinkellei]
MSADGCSDPSVVEWEDNQLMMMTACDDGRRRVYESGDKGESWTEALGTLSRVWGNKHEGPEKGVRSGFTTATIVGDGDDNNRKVMLVTLPVYTEEVEDDNEKRNEKGELHLWLTDNTHIVDIGPVSSDEENVTASTLLYKSGTNNQETLIALYEKKKSGEETQSSPGMVSVLLTEQLKRVKDVLATWKKVDDIVSKLCLSSNTEGASTETVCSAGKITAGLVGFLSGNFSQNEWMDEYLGVNATVQKNNGGAKETSATVTEPPYGVKFEGAWAEWPVGQQGENQLYHFANYNFTLVATVSIDGEPQEGSPIPLMGVKINNTKDTKNTVLMGLSYSSGGKWKLSCGDEAPKDLSSTLKPETTYQVAIVLHNGTKGSAYVDGKPVVDEQCTLKNNEGKNISHFYIGGDKVDTGNNDNKDVSVTVKNVLLYNRPLDDTEIGAL